jgi:hypothetical protein
VIARFKKLAAEPFRELETLRFVRARTRELRLRDPGKEFFKLAMELQRGEAAVRRVAGSATRGGGRLRRAARYRGAVARRVPCSRVQKRADEVDATCVPAPPKDER